MCCCAKPHVNGESGAYSWDGKTFSTREPNPPELRPNDELVFDEPGRCGGLDSHCHHIRVVKRFSGHVMLIRHGGGDESLDLGIKDKWLIDLLHTLDSNGRYWLLLRFHWIAQHAERAKADEVNAIWRKAAAEKRIHARKKRGTESVKVWITRVEAARETCA